MSSDMIRKFMDLLASEPKPMQLNENEMVDEAKGKSWVGRRIADHFSAEMAPDDTPITAPMWWLGTVVKDDGDQITKSYDNTTFNNPKEFTLTCSKSFYTRNNAIKRGQVVVKDDTPTNANGMSTDEIMPLIVAQDYVRPGSKLAQPATTEPKKVAASTGVPAGTFTVSPSDMADLEDFAHEGDRIMVDGKAIYAGFGNRSGLHSYLPTVLQDTFKKWPRAKAKLEAGAFSTLEVFTFRNINRDRGNWVKVRSFKNAMKTEAVVEDSADAIAYKKEKEVQALVYEKSGKSHGEGFTDPKQMMTSAKMKYPQAFVQNDSAIMGSERATTLWDHEGSGSKVVGVWVPSMKYGFLV